MNKGLITRIGEWMDRKWTAKATWLDVQKQEQDCSARHIAVLSLITELKADMIAHTEMVTHALQQRFTPDISNLKESHKAMVVRMDGFEKRLAEVPDGNVAKEFAELKSRFEKLELYLGMSRKVDPTKPAVAKSAFAM